MVFRHRATSVINVMGLALALCVMVALYVMLRVGYDAFHEKAERIHVVWSRTRTIASDSQVLKSYLIIALRSLYRYRFYTLANVGGLAIGMAGCLLIAVYVLGELSYDRYHEHGERIYRIYERGEQGVRLSTSAALGATLKRDVPQVVSVVRMLNPDNPVPLIRHGEKRFYEDAFQFADPEVLTTFSLPLVQGDVATALGEPFSVVVSETSARRLFGEDEPMGKVIRFKEALDLTVTGVMRDLPAHSHRRIEFLASFATVERWLGPAAVTDWRRKMHATYVLLQEGEEPASLEASLDHIWQEHVDQESVASRWELQPLRRIHLYSRQDLGIRSGGDIREVVILGTVACLVLVVACLNYANLGTALATRRAREVGLRRTIGAGQSQLVVQFLGESALVTAMAFAAAVPLAEGLAPFVGRISGSDLTIVYTSPKIVALLVLILVLATVLAGGYPAFRLARIAPVRALSRDVKIGGNSSRRAMVLVQFLVSVGLLSATAVAFEQLALIENADLGIDTEQVLVVPIRSQPMRGDPEPVKARLRELPDVTSVGAAALLPAGPLGRRDVRSVKAPNDGRPVTMDLLWVDADVIGTLGMEIVAGESFADGLEARNGYFVLNREAVRVMGWQSAEAAIGQPLEIVQGAGSGVSPTGTVVGVVEDFHAGSLRRGLRPAVLQLWPWLNYLLVRFQTQSTDRALEDVAAVMTEYDPGHPFEYAFLDDRFARIYQSDRRWGRLFAGFSGLSLLVACVGLFGLASFAAEQRRKEFGVRKVLGASALEVGRQLGGEFTMLVLVAACLACPITYVGMGSWLQEFAERVDFGVGVFAVTVGGTLLAAWLTVAYHAIRASRTNPVDALRYE